MKFKLKTLLFSFTLVFNIFFLYSQNPDTIITRSGDQLAGEIVSMSKAVLTFETDYSDSDFKIEWEKIKSLKTSQNYRVHGNDGEIYVGLIEYGIESPDSFVIFTDAGKVFKDFYSIAEINEVDEKFIDKLRLGINVGYSYTKASGSQQISVRSNAGYVTDMWTLSSSINSFDTRIGDVVTSRSDANINFRHLLANNWFALANVDWFNSEEQQIDLRTTAALGFGNYLVRNIDMVFLLYAGAAYNNEAFTNSEEDNLQSYEAFLAGEYDLFGAEDLDILTSFIAYPSLTEKDRVRAVYKLDFVWDIIYDFEAKLGFTLNYDSNPPNDAEKSDYVVSFTLGWSL